MPESLVEARALLERVTPLWTDCGRICDRCCCRQSEESEGMLLFPGEERWVTPKVGERLTPTQGGWLFTCCGECDRNQRPLACRMFPLFPYVDKDGRVRAVYDPRGYRLCPLVRQSAHVPLRRDFVRAVRRAGRLLMADPDCAAFLQQSSGEIDSLLALLPMRNGRTPIQRRSLRAEE